MANAFGRLTGTLLSGLLYQWQGLEACLWASAALVVAAGLVSLALPRDRSPSPAAAAATV
jgi:predicted MFS family arabinose efflux permease